MLLYYITDRRQFPGSAMEQRAALLRKIAEATRGGVDYVQLREKDLSARELLALAEEARDAISGVATSGSTIHNSQLATRLLINSRLDIALACGADGVHLRSDDISATDARAAWTKAVGTRVCLIACSCHTAEDVRRAEVEGADFVVFAPVFEKSGQRGVGLERLRAACQVGIPVLALGGVKLENAHACLEAGAAGMAGIRLFQDNDVAEVVGRLRSG
jgi:thiamine-phosphate pyrophosphorylase